jgi:hypothetical protein
MGKFDFPMIPCIDVMDMPQEVRDYFADEGIYFHCQNDVIAVDDDGNVFAEWIKSEGYVFSDEWELMNGDKFAIMAT